MRDPVHVDLAFINKDIDYPYYLLARDEASELMITYFLRSKSQVPEFIGKLSIDLETAANCRIRVIRSDEGREFMNELTKGILLENRILHQQSAEYIPQHNGTAERAFQTINIMSRVIFVRAGSETIEAATYLSNRLPTKCSAASHQERFPGKKPTHGYHVPFGAEAHAFGNGLKEARLSGVLASDLT